MERLDNPVRPEDRLLPRTVPLDRRWVSRLMDAAYDLLTNAVQNLEPDEVIPWGAYVAGAVVTLPGLERTHGQRTRLVPEVQLTLRTRPRPGGRMMFSGQMTEPRGKIPHLEVHLPGGIGREGWEHLLSGEAPRLIRSVLIHELTHVVDNAVEDSAEDYVQAEHGGMQAYVNQGVEWRAILPQILHEVAISARFHPGAARRSILSKGAYVEALLLRSPSWETFGRYVSDKNHRILLVTLAAVLTREGLLDTFDDR